MKTLVLACMLALSAASCGAPGPATRGALGSLVTHDHVIAIEQTPGGLRYTIVTRAGDLVAENLTQDELAAIAPDAVKHLETGTARTLIAD
jgi:hypothetical protein